jgi:hypothetical protein
MSTALPTSASGAPFDDGPPAWLQIVREKVEGLRFGVVQIVVHDGRVTQIERTEKTRLGGPGPRSE